MPQKTMYLRVEVSFICGRPTPGYPCVLRTSVYDLRAGLDEAIRGLKAVPYTPPPFGDEYAHVNADYNRCRPFDHNDHVVYGYKITRRSWGVWSGVAEWQDPSPLWDRVADIDARLEEIGELRGDEARQQRDALRKARIELYRAVLVMNIQDDVVQARLLGEETVAAIERAGYEASAYLEVVERVYRELS
jgi:hypothetical protein